MTLKENLRNGTDTEAVAKIAQSLRLMLADVFALYIKTKNFHWHMSGTHFRDYHLLLDEQAEQVFAITDEIAERARKLGATTIRSIGDIANHQRLQDSEQDHVARTECCRNSVPITVSLLGTCGRPTRCASDTATLRQPV